MERIFKIKTKTNKDPHSQYPSERRYSASIVIGLGVVFFQLFMYSILMGTILVHKITLKNQTEPRAFNNITTEEETAETNTYYYVDIPVLICVSCYVMAAGYLLSFITSLLAWKQWYIDHNITFFFLTSSLSTITSTLTVITSLTTIINIDYVTPDFTPLTFSLSLNIFILSFVGVIWSILSVKVSYRGMKNSYPDDAVCGKSGAQIQVSNVRKGDKNHPMYPPDIISHFPPKDKLAKYLPKRNENGLPKEESNDEYRKRVEKFLDGEGEDDHQG